MIFLFPRWDVWLFPEGDLDEIRAPNSFLLHPSEIVQISASCQNHFCSSFVGFHLCWCFFVSERVLFCPLQVRPFVRYMSLNAPPGPPQKKKQTQNRTCEFYVPTKNLWHHLIIFWCAAPIPPKKNRQVNLAQPTSSCNPCCWWILTVTSPRLFLHWEFRCGWLGLSRWKSQISGCVQK